MRKQLGVLTSFLFLCAVTLIGVGCSESRSYDDTSPVYYEQNAESDYGYSGYEESYSEYRTDSEYRTETCAAAPRVEPCHPACPAPCAEPCRPACPAPCAEPCQQTCAAPCAEPCHPACPAPCAEPCRPACPAPCAQPCRPACAAPCPAPCAPACEPCEPMCKILPKCCHPSQNELRCQDSIIVRARNPKMCLLGDQYPLDFEVQACDDVCDVVVTTNLPEGVTFLSSEPPAQVEGRKLTWNFGSMSKCERLCARVWLKCECEGELCACFCATASPVRFCALLCAKPILTCEKCGPEQVCPGDPVNYTITVTNKGSCTAEDVVVVDNLPCELEHSSGLKTLSFKLGCLEPCQTKKVNICTTACRRGKVCNSAVVSACNADSVSCQWCTCICCCDIDLCKSGPKEVPIGKNADYQITVVNTGDLPLTEVVVTDTAPNATSIVAANGATINCNQAVWRLRELKPGEKANFTLTLTTCTPGCFTNKVHVTNCQQCNACADFTTRWKGRPALNFCIKDTEDPICIGERTSYTVDITNQGSESDSNVALVVRFPNEIVPKSACGDSAASISGQTVTFTPYAVLRPRETIRYRIDAEAKSSGDARVVAEVSSDSIKTPIVQQESTIVN